MDARSPHGHGHAQGHHRPGRGHSSYAMQDPEAVFEALGLEPGRHVLDLGCGSGDYALRMAREVGPAGLVHALDKSAHDVTPADRAGLGTGPGQPPAPGPRHDRAPALH